MFTRMASAVILMAGCALNAHAITPSGGWTLKDKSPDVKDYSFRIDVDPGEKSDVQGNAPSSVYWSQYVKFNTPSFGYHKFGYLGLMRDQGAKVALVSIWDGIDAKGGAIPAVQCFEYEACVSIKGTYDWKLGHHYRFRMEKSARTPSDDSGDWWQVTLADLTSGMIDLLGELKTPKWGGLRPSNGVFLEYFHGPFDCTSLRHARATMGQIKGDYGRATSMESSNGDAYGSPDACAKENILPGMDPKDYGSSSWDKEGTLTLLGNNFQGLHQWGQYQSIARKGMMFAKDISVTEPYIFEALHDGAYGVLPKEGEDNEDWKSIGIGYPIINDLRLRHQRVREWRERNHVDVKMGDYFIFHDPDDGDTKYFRIKRRYPLFFPWDKASNGDWEYVGRYPKPGEALSPPLRVHQRNRYTPYYKKGWLFIDDNTKALYIVKDENGLMNFSDKPGDNAWWTFIGYHA